MRQLRSHVDAWTNDRFFAPDMEAAERLIAAGTYLTCIDPQTTPSLRST
jgi:histidine ammonia-lyase